MGRRVLVIDDDPDAAWATAALLRHAGFDTRAEADPLAALVVLGDFRPDACVLDLHMPGLSGFDLARWVRASLGAGVRLVALTGDADPDLDRVAAAAGFDAVVRKPGDPDQLAAVLSPPGG